MSNATDPPQSQAPIRPAVFDMKGGEKAHLATITLSRDQQNNGDVTLDNPIIYL